LLGISAFPGRVIRLRDLDRYLATSRLTVRQYLSSIARNRALRLPDHRGYLQKITAHLPISSPRLRFT